jgi:glycosyltransferase involved in cell wall biosynthesis
MSASVQVILPALNEAAALPAVLRSLPHGYGAIVVDNGSTDRTAAVAAAEGALVVTEERRGFGAAVNAGLAVATADIVAIMDADGSFDSSELPKLVELVERGAADLVLGRRTVSVRGAWPLHARLANRSLARTLRRLTGYDLQDLGPMRVARRAALLNLDLKDRRSGYPLEMLLVASMTNWKVLEVPVKYLPRIGKSKVTGTIRGTITAIKDMRKQLRKFRDAAA